MGAEGPQSPRAHRRWRPLLIAAIVVFLLSFGVTLRFTFRPSRTLARWAESQIATLFAPGVHVTIDDARIDARTPALVLRGTRIGEDADHPDVEIPLARVEVRFRGDEIVEVSRVVLDHPRVRYAAINRLFPSGAGATTPPHLPTLHIHDASLIVEETTLGTLVFAEVDATASESAPGHIRIDGSVKTPFEGLLRVEGQIELATGGIAIGVMTETPIDLGRPSGATLDKNIDAWRKKLEPQGRVSITAKLERDNEAQSLRGSVEVSGTGLSSNIPGVSLRPVDCTLDVVIGHEGVGRVAARGRVLTGQFDALGEVRFDPKTFALRKAGIGVQVNTLELGNDVQRVIHEIDQGAEDVYHGLDPQGPINATLSLGYDESSPDLAIAADIDLARIRVTFQGIPGKDNEIDASFPYTVQDVEGRVSFRPGRIALAGVHGKMGLGQLVCSGEITGDGLVGIDLVVRADGVPIDDEIRKAIRGLPGGFEAWSMFTLDGRLDFDVQATRPLGERPVHVVVRIASQGTVNGSYNDFPVPVTGLTGAVLLDRGLSTFAFDGQARNGRVRVEGTIDNTDGLDGKAPRTPAIRLRIAGQRIDVDETLAKAFEQEIPDVAAEIVHMDPQMTTEFEFDGERARDAASQDLRSCLRVEGVHGVTQRIPDFDMKLEDVALTMHVTSTPRLGAEPDRDIVIDGGMGRYRGHLAYGIGSLRLRTRAASGAASAPGRERSLELTATGIDFPLDRELMAAVALANPGMAGKLERYDFGGRIDTTITKRMSPLVDVLSFGVELREAAIRGPGLPGTCDHLVGYLTYESSGPIRAKAIEGRLDGVPVRLDDFELAFATPASPMRFAGVLTSLQSIDLATALLKCAPETKPWLDSFGFNAQAEPKQLRWELTLPDVGPPVFQASGTIYAHDGVLPDVKISKIQGSVEVLDLVFDGDGFRTSVRAEGDSFEIADLYGVTKFSGVIDLTPLELKISQVSGMFAGGRVRAAREPFLDMDLRETPKPWTLNVALEGAQLSDLLKGVSGSTDLKGLVRFDLLLSGKGGEQMTYAGRGTLNVTDATLFDVPGFKAIYQGLQLKKKPTFHEMVGEFAIRSGGMIEFSRLDLESDPIGLQGAGMIDFGGGIDAGFGIRFRVPILDIIPGFSQILGWIFDQILEIQVVGNVENPRIIPRPSFSKNSPLRRQVVAPRPQLDLGERF